MAALASLRSRPDFNRLRQNGRKSKPSPWLIIYRQRNNLGQVRLGCTIPTYVGGAVVRNRLRRWCKEYFRRWAHQIQQEKTLDISVVFLRTEAKTFRALKHEELDAIFDTNFG